MNLYDALNQGDASLKEPHLTSVLYFLFKKTFKANGESSFITYFLQKNLGLSAEYISLFDIEEDIKIEQVLRNETARKDCDITIILTYSGERIIVNIENKISNSSFQANQVQEQETLLKQRYPNAAVRNILILPFAQLDLKISLDNTQIVYWYNENDSLISQITEYSTKFLEPLENYDLKSSVGPFVDFFNAFGKNLEQTFLATQSSERGPKNKYSKSMFEYLNEIATNWESYFSNPEEVKVKDLLVVFNEQVVRDLKNTNEESELENILVKFKDGALVAQPKIMTINEKNRIHFNINNPNEKRLFYYPDFPDGEYDIKWKDLRIKPLKNMTEDKAYVTIWKDKLANEIRVTTYKK